MRIICPADFTACPDDACRSSETCSLNGGRLFSRCAHCKAVYDPDFGDCDCELYDEDDDDAL